MILGFIDRFFGNLRGTVDSQDTSSPPRPVIKMDGAKRQMDTCEGEENGAEVTEHVEHDMDITDLFR